MIWLRLIPSWAYWLIAVIAVGVALNMQGRYAGAAKIQAAWDSDKVAAENQAEVMRLARQSAIDQGAAQYEGKAEKARIVTRTIIKEVDRYVPNTLPLLPPAVRVLHDAAAAGEEVDDSQIADAAPVAPSTLTKTVAANYGTCNDEKQRLAALQAIVATLTGDGE